MDQPTDQPTTSLLELLRAAEKLGQGKVGTFSHIRKEKNVLLDCESFPQIYLAFYCRSMTRTEHEDKRNSLLSKPMTPEGHNTQEDWGVRSGTQF